MTGPTAPEAARRVDAVDDWTRGWISPQPRFMQRTSHAVRAGDGVWFVDPVDDAGMVDAALADLGAPAGVIQLLDRHARDGAAIAERLDVPLVRLPAPGADLPFRVVPVIRSRAFRWHEVALWEPERRVLVVAEALGTAPYFRAPGQPVGPHPMLRLFHPPRGLADLEPEHLLVGHGEGLHGPETAAAVRTAVASSRRRIPAWAASLARRRGG